MRLDDILSEWNAGAAEFLSRPEALRKLARLRAEASTSRTLLADESLRDGERMGVMFHTLTLLPDEPVVLHNHDFFELAYLRSGTATHYHAGGETALHPGDLVFLNPYVRHEMKIDGGACLINLIIRPELMQQTMAGNLADAPQFSEYVISYFHLAQPRSDFIYVSHEAAGAVQIRTLVESIAVECYDRPYGWESACVGYLTALFATLSREQVVAVGATSTPPLITDLLRYLEAHRIDATLETVANAFGYSPSHISRLIHKHTQKRFSQIVIDLRLDQAQEYLERTNLPIHIVAKRSGFTSTSYLARLFKQRHGLTPKEFRALHRLSTA